MKSGKTAGHGNGRPYTPTARQAKRAGPKLEAGPEASAERSEGTMEARRGETPQAARCATRTTARPAISQVAGDAQPSKWNEQLDQDEQTRGIVDLRLMLSGRSGAAGSAVFEGCQASRGGDSPQGFPLEASEARSAPSGARRHHAESSGRRLDSATGIHGDDESSRYRAPRAYRPDSPVGW
ncbi:hypothetical protein IPC150_01290 [Pseudomonas aeruginosa]|nr:hypothetical protein [Pseudomonas aeruginosa]MCO3134154.1 hypothetical protein [Pseudomonas aeruginosa]RTV44166.1 hypothetical protein DY989_30445 [Pseudomonas aeruginosa]TEC37970.1 hypothetical protein IPC1593_18795 [Pseudomonas aeruginosa]TEM94019.1 hypothetical protein IPC151_01290 [Pseudomonas aeruginosa]